MRERPILFSGAMVRALVAGTKTQTRRVVKPQPDMQHDGEPYWAIGGYRVWGYRPASAVPLRAGGNPLPCPYGQPGDRLWVREEHWWFKDEHDPVTGYTPPKMTAEDVLYRADGDDGRRVWRPSIHMPRWASRITLEVLSVRVERLQDISEADAIAEGCPRVDHEVNTLVGAREMYRRLWEQINGPGSWDANPWVWVVEFKRVEA